MPRINLDDLLDKQFKALFYGEPGVGKTTLCGSVLDVPEMLPVLWCEVDGGIMTLRNKILQHRQDITVLALKTDKDVSDMEKILYSETPFKTVVLDSLTEFYWLLMRLHHSSQGRSVDFPDGTDYRTMGSRVIEMLRKIRDQGTTHFITTGTTNVLENRISGELHWAVALPGQLPRQVVNFFDILGYLSVSLRVRTDGQVRETRRRLQVQPYNNVHAKTRVSWTKLGAVIDDPTMRKIFDDYMSVDDSVIEAEPQIITEGEIEDDAS